MGPRQCPNCGRGFVFNPDKRYCDLTCCEAFWSGEVSKLNSFLIEKGLFREFGEWYRARRESDS